MTQRDIVKQNIDKYIESLRDNNQNVLDKIIEHKYVRVIETQLINGFNIKQLPNEKVFKVSTTLRILLTVFFSLVFLSPLLAYKSSTLEKFQTISLLSFLCIPIVLFIWLNPKNKRFLILNYEGITYEGDFYPWAEIVTTHIEFIQNANKGLESYLIIGLLNGGIERLAISNLNFRGLLFDSISENEKALGHYIELYKNTR